MSAAGVPGGMAAHVAREATYSAAVRCQCGACSAVRWMASDPGRVDGAESGDEFRRVAMGEGRVAA